MNKTTFQIYGLKKSFYGFTFPADSYIMGQAVGSIYGYFYGWFTGYNQSGTITPKKHLVKLNENLTIANSFDIGSGFDSITYIGSSVLEQPDGYLIVTGVFTTYKGATAQRIVRLDSNGTNDGTMGNFYGGGEYTQVPTLQSDGKIIVTGGCTQYVKAGSYNSTGLLSRLNANGDYDNSFVTGSGFNQPTFSAVSNSDLSMIVTGYFDTYKGVSCSGGIIKLDQYGNKVTSFASGSGFNIYLNNPIYAIKIPGESSFYVSGRFTEYNGTSVGRIVKLQQNGSIDPSFISIDGFNGTVNNMIVIWGNKLFTWNGDFTQYEATTAMGTIILNADGSVLWASDVYYSTPIVIGNTLFGTDGTGYLKALYTYIP